MKRRESSYDHQRYTERNPKISGRLPFRAKLSKSLNRNFAVASVLRDPRRVPAKKSCKLKNMCRNDGDWSLAATFIYKQADGIFGSDGNEISSAELRVRPKPLGSKTETQTTETGSGTALEPLHARLEGSTKFHCRNEQSIFHVAGLGSEFSLVLEPASTYK